MKFQIMLGILFTLLSKRRVSASELAAKFDCSTRSIYRYVEELIVAGIPVDIARGAGGGIYISDTYKLPKGFMTREEYAAAREAMLAMLSETGDGTLASALEKITAQSKTERSDTAVWGNILVDCGTWGDEKLFSERIAFMTRAIEERRALDVDYADRTGERTRRRILPHLLVYKQNIWYVYAFCKKRGAFRLFKLGRIRAALETDEIFERIPFSREDIPLSFWRSEENAVEAKFEVSTETLPFAEEWLGVENVYEADGKHYAAVTLPDDEALVGKILSAGAGFRVLAPESLRERVVAEAKKIARMGEET